MTPFITHADPKPITGKLRYGGLVSDQATQPTTRKRWWQRKGK